MTITLKQLKPLACHTRTHCVPCRTDASWSSLKRINGGQPFSCPHRVTVKDGQIVEPAPQGPANLNINPGPVQLTNSIRKPKGVGDYFHEIIVAKYNVSPCSKCLDVMREMNELGVEGCERERHRLIDGIWERRNNLSGWRKIAAKMPGAEHLAKRELNGLLDQAIKRFTAQDLRGFVVKDIGEPEYESWE